MEGDRDGFRSMLRRVVTGERDDGRSVVVLDGGPSAAADAYGLFELWHEPVSGGAGEGGNLGPRAVTLAPGPGRVKVRWFRVDPLPADLGREQLDAALRDVWRDLDAERYAADQQRHTAMHATPTLDVICVIAGEVRLVLDDGETTLRPGHVVIQRGTAHAWEAVDGPALLLAVMIDRSEAP
jgi:mannose-6-phosphate isomerase-like protein (cupin superfamily)